MPFWFWNDELSNEGILAQIDDFHNHGIDGFVIHPRVGLPRDTGWMSPKLLGFMTVAIEEAAKRKMKVILYDEGMYPSGSSSGQVVEKDPQLACRCLALHEVNQSIPAGAKEVAKIKDDDGKEWLVIDRPADSYIRGLHYIDQGPKEDEPPAGDILNPQTTQAIIDLVYQPFADHFGKYFGSTILGIFTDEPNPLGKSRERRVFPYTTGILPHLSRLLGYDFTPHLAALWSKEESTKKYRDDYRYAIRQRMDETWYAPLSAFCEKNKIALCGHPDAGDEIGVQRFFQFPGQDLVWRFVEPDKPTALEGAESTQAKCSSSAMIHYNRRRNSNEFAGAYGPQTTFTEIKWLADWCLVRGVNLLIPHAFYYSIRGERVNERPPQIGPHTREWATFKSFADHCRRLCWINTDSQHICNIAILTNADRCPWPAASVLLQNQRDFNYLDPHSLLHDAKIEDGVLSIAGMKYQLLIIDDAKALSDEVAMMLKPMIEKGHVLSFGDAIPHANIPKFLDKSDFIRKINSLVPTDISLESPSKALRIRHVRKNSDDYYLLFNEAKEAISTKIEFKSSVRYSVINTESGSESVISNPSELKLAGYEIILVRGVQ